MANDKITKRAFCKKAVIAVDEAGGKQTLQKLLQSAVEKLPKAKSRTEIFGDNQTQRRLINDYVASSSHGAFCGILVSYERGHNAVALAEDDEADSYPIAQIAPQPTDEGKRREFLEGLLYFVVIGNHVALLQSSAVRSGELENHLAHLIVKAGLAPKGMHIALPDAVGKDIAKRVSDKHVKEVTLGMPLVAPVQVDLTAGDEPPSNAVQREGNYFVVGGLGYDVINSLLPGGLKGIKLQDALNENIELSLHIKYVRTVTDNGQRVLDNLAMALRNQDGADARIELNGGETISGEEIKLSKSMRLPSVGGIVTPTVAFDEMTVWLHELIKSGTVAP